MPYNFLVIALVSLICFDLARLAVSLLRKRAVAHKGLLKMAAALQAWGLKTIPDVLTSIATGDWIQADKDIEFWVRLFEGNPEAAIAELDKVLVSVAQSSALSTLDLASLTLVKTAVDAAVAAATK